MLPRAPFYCDWPVEVSLLHRKTHAVVWRSTFQDADLREWLPGDGWAEPTWKPYGKWSGKAAEWDRGKGAWKTPPKAHTVRGDFKVDAPAGTYILALAVLDPAGNLPSLRFATANYLKGGRHSYSDSSRIPRPQTAYWDGHPNYDLCY